VGAVQVSGVKAVVLRYARYDDPRYPCHERSTADIFRKCQELSILSPEFPELDPELEFPTNFSRPFFTPPA